MATFNNIAGEESATVTFRVGTIQIARGSTNEQQEIFCLGDPESSVGIARVSSAAPKSTDAGLIVRIAGGASTATDLAFRALFPSTAADNPVSINPPSTAFVKNAGFGVDSSNALLTKVDGYSTIVNISTGHVTVDTGSVTINPASTAHVKNAGFAVDSSNYLQTKVDGYSTIVSVSTGHVTVDTGTVRAQLYTSTGGGIEGSTTQPTGQVVGLHVRPVFPSLQSTCRSTVGNNSTRETLVSSAAGARVKVYAYSITSTAQAVNDVGFFSSNANLLWPLVMQSISSGIVGANLAVAPPAWLFASEAGSALTFGITGTTGTYKVGVSYFTDT